MTIGHSLVAPPRIWGRRSRRIPIVSTSCRHQLLRRRSSWGFNSGRHGKLSRGSTLERTEGLECSVRLTHRGNRVLMDRFVGPAFRTKLSIINHLRRGELVHPIAPLAHSCGAAFRRLVRRTNSNRPAPGEPSFRGAAIPSEISSVSGTCSAEPIGLDQAGFSLNVSWGRHSRVQGIRDSHPVASWRPQASPATGLGHTSSRAIRFVHGQDSRLRGAAVPTFLRQQNLSFRATILSSALKTLNQRIDSRFPVTVGFRPTPCRSWGFDSRPMT